jgi:hypothetical protein
MGYMISTFEQLDHNGMAPWSVWRHQPTFIAYWLRLTTSSSSKCVFIYFHLFIYQTNGEFIGKMIEESK